MNKKLRQCKTGLGTGLGFWLLHPLVWAQPTADQIMSDMRGFLADATELITWIILILAYLVAAYLIIDGGWAHFQRSRRGRQAIHYRCACGPGHAHSHLVPDHYWTGRNRQYSQLMMNRAGATLLETARSTGGTVARAAGPAPETTGFVGGSAKSHVGAANGLAANGADHPWPAERGRSDRRTPAMARPDGFRDFEVSVRVVREQ